MKIRSKEQLIDSLNYELSWRKKELSTLKSNVEKSRAKLEATAIRAGIVLLYAHWEGFIKQASESYLEYVINQRLSYKDLSINFVAIAIKQKLVEFEQTNKSTIHCQVVDFLYNNSNEKAYIIKESVIKTQSNLNSIIFREITTAIGLDFSPYSTKAKLIDEQLLNYRNNVAHGQYLDIDVKEYIVLHDEVRLMIDRFRTDIENAAILSKYIRNNVS